MQIARLSVYFAVVGVNLVYVSLDHRSPSYDEAHFLDLTARYLNAWGAGGLHALLHQVRTIDPARAPLYSVMLMPFAAVLGTTMRTALLFNVVLWVALLTAVQHIASDFFDRRTGLLAMVLVATIPELVGLSHDALQELPLAVVLTTALSLLIRTQQFERRRVSILLGLIIGLGTLTKFSFIPFFFLPLLVYCCYYLPGILKGLGQAATRRQAISRLTNLTVAIAIGTGIALLWYVPVWAVTIQYLAAPFAASVTPYLNHASVLAFSFGVVTYYLGWLIALTAIAGMAFGLPAIIRRLTGAPRSHIRHVAYRAAFLMAWVGLPWAVSGISPDQDMRYMITVFPGLAVLASGLAMTIGWVPVRRSIVIAAVTLCTYQTAFISMALPAKLAVLPNQVSWWTPLGNALILFNGQGFGFEQGPIPTDYAAAVVGYIEDRMHASGQTQMRTVGLLENDEFVGGNTISYSFDARNDKLTAVDIPNQPLESLRQTLAGCDFILLPLTAPGDPYFRHVDASFAAQEVTPDLLAAFRHKHLFPNGTGGTVEVLDRLQ